MIKQGKTMKTLSQVIIVAMMLVSNHMVWAGENENILPPTGPYKSMEEVKQFNLAQHAQINQQYKPEKNNPVNQAQNQFYQNSPRFQSEPLPEWVKQRQTEMDNWINQRNNQIREQVNQPQFQTEAPEWVKQRQLQMEQMMRQNRQAQPNWNNQMPPPQWNRNQAPMMPNQNNQGKGYRPNNPFVPGPVYRPRVAPNGFQNQPGIQAQRQWAQPPRLWR